jgi:ubiquinone/menaquinone biosynthesis C-methylase UbiE
VNRERESHWDAIAAQMSTDIQSFYAGYAGQSVLASLQELLPRQLDGARILDIGCGTGRYFLFLAQLGATHLVGVDVGQNLLTMCHRRDPTIRLTLAKADQLPFANQSFDVVLSMGLIEHYHNPVPVLAEFTRLVRSGGTLILETPNVLNLVFTLYKVINRKRLTWEHWWGPWNLLHLVRQDAQLTPGNVTSSVVMSWLLTRFVAKANRVFPGFTGSLVRVERLWPLRYLGSMMFVSAIRH